uniref:Uncharacterized protein n=1 Tax=Arundo donax TaxID=35708 RepID=A0A0A8Y1H6_ARUDO
MAKLRRWTLRRAARRRGHGRAVATRPCAATWWAGGLLQCLVPRVRGRDEPGGEVGCGEAPLLGEAGWDDAAVGCACDEARQDCAWQGGTTVVSAHGTARTARRDGKAGWRSAARAARQDGEAGRDGTQLG